jgi:hypothetical protein
MPGFLNQQSQEEATVLTQKYFLHMTFVISVFEIMYQAFVFTWCYL